MPDGPDPRDNQIDVTLSMLDGEHMNAFMKELTAVRDNFKTMTEDLSRLADSFEKSAKESVKAGDAASRPTAREGSTDSFASSAAQSNQRQQELFGDLNYGDTDRGSYASVPTSEGQAVDGMANEAPAGNRDIIHTPQSLDELTKRTLGRLQSHHPFEAAGLGAAEAVKLLHSRKSSDASEPDQLSLDGLAPESLSQEDNSWTQKLSESKGTVGGRIGNMLRSRWNPEPPEGGLDPGAEGAIGGPSTPNDVPGMDLLKAGTLATVWSNLRLSHMMHNGGGEETQREYTGASFGYKQKGGDVTIPGTDIGFRMPFANSASLKMEEEKFEKLKYRAQPGLNKEQVDTIFNSGYEQGFTPQTEQATDVYRTAAGNMMKQNSAMGSDPTYLNMLGEAVKYGSVSIADFNKNMSNIPLIAAKANVGLGEFMQGVQDIAQQIQATGGTPFQAADAAKQWTASTGQSPESLSKIMASPFYSTVAYQQTGLLPFEQGLMSGAQTKATAADTVYRLADMPGFKFPNLKTTSPGGGQGVIKGSDRTAAMISNILGMDRQKVQDLLNHRRRIEGESAMESDSRMMLSELRRGQSAKSVMDDKNINAHDHITTMGDLLHDMHTAGFSKKERDEVLHTGKTKHTFLGIDALAPDTNQNPAKAMEDRIKKMQQIEAEHASKGRGKGGQHVEIDLTDAAKKLIKVVGAGASFNPLNPASIAKEAANAGGGLVNDAFGIASSPIKAATDVIGAIGAIF